MLKATFSLVISVSLGLMAHADQCNLAEPYAQVLTAEHEALKSQLALESQKLQTLERLRQDGHASWLEHRKQRLVVDKLKAKSKTYAKFHGDLTDAKLTAADLHGVISSRRLIFSNVRFRSHAGEPSVLNSELDQQRASLHEALALAQSKRDKLKQQHEGLHPEDPWKVAFGLRHTLASHQCSALAARLNFVESFALEMKGVQSVPANPDERSLNSALAQSALQQCLIHGNLIQHSLDNELRRFDVLQSWANEGMATTRDLKQVAARIDSLKQLRYQQRSMVKTLQNASRGEHYVSHAESAAAVNKAVGWQLQLQRFEECQAEYHLTCAELEKEFNVEILARLQTAAGAARQPVDAMAAGTNLDAALATGQQREMDSYRWRIRLFELESELASARLDSARQGSQWVRSTRLRQLNPFGSNVLSWRTLPTGLVSSPMMLTGVSFGRGLEGPADMEAFLVESSSVEPPIHFELDNSSYRPVRLADYRGSLNSYARRPASRLSRAFQFSFDQAQPSTSSLTSFGSDGMSTRKPLPKFERAYHYGILRPELRSLLPPGNAPWYFPGAPNNLRLDWMDN